MRTDKEIQAKLAECLTHATPKYNAAGDCSVWEYWREFARVLQNVKYATEGIIAQFQEGYLLAGAPQRAAMYSWLLEDPSPVITLDGRIRAHERAKAQRKPMYLWADSRGTHVRSAKPDCRCEVIEPVVKPRKRNLLVHVPAAFRRKAE